MCAVASGLGVQCVCAGWSAECTAYLVTAAGALSLAPPHHHIVNAHRGEGGAQLLFGHLPSQHAAHQVILVGWLHPCLLLLLLLLRLI